PLISKPGIQNVFPAPAGINRESTAVAIAGICVPRASGDKPVCRIFDHTGTVCSPRQRG
ncbi:hypothetical protein HGQ21_004560, partial [Salmonella enterica]|nr:hypothetical protein [Salmonella enterica]